MTVHSSFQKYERSTFVSCHLQVTH